MPSSCESTPLMSKAVCVPTVMMPTSMNSWIAWLSSPAAMKIRPTPVQRKNVARLMRRLPW